MKISNTYAVKAKALIYENELNYLSRCVLDYPDIETGGDLFGFWTHSGFPVIQYIIGPGKNSNHQVALFNQDLNYLRKIGDALRMTHGLQHIGEWHSHHKLGLAEPSGHDITTVTKAIDNYNLNNFFLVITNVHQNSSGINGFMFNRHQGRIFDYTGWVILKGESPIRSVFDKQYPNIIYQPQIQQASIVDLTTSSLGETEYVKPEYLPEYWLSERSNHMVLKKIVDGLSHDFDDVNVFQNNDDKSVYLTFRDINHLYSLSFPSDFPQSKPIFKRVDGETRLKVNTTNIDWNPEEEISSSTISFTQHSLGVNQNIHLPKTTER